jgi:hypothetical protein
MLAGVGEPITALDDGVSELVAAVSVDPHPEHNATAMPAVTTSAACAGLTVSPMLR